MDEEAAVCYAHSDLFSQSIQYLHTIQTVYAPFSNIRPDLQMTEHAATSSPVNSQSYDPASKKRPAIKNRCIRRFFMTGFQIATYNVSMGPDLRNFPAFSSLYRRSQRITRDLLSRTSITRFGPSGEAGFQAALSDAFPVTGERRFQTVFSGIPSLLRFVPSTQSVANQA